MAFGRGRLVAAVLGLAATASMVTACDSGSSAASRRSPAPAYHAPAGDRTPDRHVASTPSDPAPGGHGVVTTDVNGNKVILPPIYGPPIPATSIADVKGQLAAQWPITFQQAGPTAYVKFTLPGSPRQLYNGVRSAPDDTSGRVGMVQCEVRQTDLVVDGVVVDFIRSCIAPALTDQQRQAADSWLGAHAASVTAKEISQRLDLGTAWLYAVNNLPGDFYIRLVGK